MKTVIQDKKQTSRVLQPKVNVISNHLMDGRSNSAIQAKMINMITSSNPIQRTVLTRSQREVVNNTYFEYEYDMINFAKTFSGQYSPGTIKEMVEQILAKSYLESRMDLDDPEVSEGDENDEISANCSYHGDLDEYDDPSEIDNCISEMGTIQLARKGNTLSGPKTYTGTFGKYTKISYKTGSNGEIDFDTPCNCANTSWPRSPVLADSLVNLKGKIKNSDRQQHFALADYAYAINNGKKHASYTTKLRKGLYTWHHMKKRHNMVLVDMTVHAKHGHNGGVYLW